MSNSNFFSDSVIISLMVLVIPYGKNEDHKMITVMECKKCGKIYPLGEAWCPFCGIRLMETAVENAGDADAFVPNMNQDSATGKLEPGIGSDAGLYSVLLGIFVVIICILGGVWGYGMFGGSIGGIFAGLMIGLFCGIFSTLNTRLLIIVARNTKIIADNQCKIGQDNSAKED